MTLARKEHPSTNTYELKSYPIAFEDLDTACPDVLTDDLDVHRINLNSFWDRMYAGFKAENENIEEL